MQPHSEKWPHTPVSLCLPLTGSQEAFQPNTSAHEEFTLWRTLGSSMTQTLFFSLVLTLIMLRVFQLLYKCRLSGERNGCFVPCRDGLPYGLVTLC